MSNVDKLIESLASLSVKDALSLVKKLEEEWGVSAAAVQSAAPAQAAAQDDGGSAEFEVIVKSVDASAKIGLVRHVKDALGLTLLDAKKFVDGLPKPLKSGLSQEDADKLKEDFEKLGAVVELKKS